MATKLFDSTIVSTAEEALDFIGNILESSTEYSVQHDSSADLRPRSVTGKGKRAGIRAPRCPERSQSYLRLRLQPAERNRPGFAAGQRGLRRETIFIERSVPESPGHPG